MVESYRLHISTFDYLDEKTFYIHPKRLGLLSTLAENTFDSCLIDYTSLDLINNNTFVSIAKVLKAKKECKFIILNPISIMQDSDAKQIRSCAKIAGFENIQIIDEKYTDLRSKKEHKTKSVICYRPERLSRNSKQSIEIVETITKSDLSVSKTSENNRLLLRKDIFPR